MVLQKNTQDQLEREWTIEEVLKKVNQQPKLLKHVMKEKMAYMGHLIRKNDNILEQHLTVKIEENTV